MRAIKNIIGAVFISIAALIAWVFIIPGYEMQTYLRTSIEIRSSVLSTKSELIKKVADLNVEYLEKFNELKRLSLVVPSEKNIAEVITSIEDISSQNGINVSELTIVESEEIGKVVNYGSLGISIGFSGSYDAILSFLGNIEKHIRLIDVTSLGLSVKSEESSGEQILLVGSLKGSAYFLKPIVQEKKVIRAPTAEE